MHQISANIALYLEFRSWGTSGHRLVQFIALVALPFLTMATDAAAAEAKLLEEVVVTAQKREQSIQDVGISISAFSGEKLDEFSVVRPTDVLRQIPNMTFFSIFGEAQTPNICIRGICLLNFTDGIEPPVAMYTDEVYRGTGFGQSVQIFDVERFEVLKGPQGTLYGRNSTAGVVNVVSRKPTKEFTVDLGAQYGSYQTVVVEGAISGPITSSIRGRLAARSHHADGWNKGFYDGAESNDADTFGARGMLEFDLGEGGNLLLTTHYSRVDQTTEAFADRGYSVPGTIDVVPDDPSTPNVFEDAGTRCAIADINGGRCAGDALLGSDAFEYYGAFEPGRWQGFVTVDGSPPENHIEDKGASATLNWDFDGWKLTSISSYGHSTKRFSEDLDGIALLAIEDLYFVDHKQWSQELRASGDHNGAAWLFGAFYYDEKKDVGFSVFPPSDFTAISLKDTRSWAAFGQVDVPISDRLTATLGARLTHEERDLDFSRTSTFVSNVAGEKRDVSDEVFTGKFGMQWKPSSDTLVYGNLSTGFKSGDFNTQFIFGSVDPTSPLDAIKPVDREELTAYEVGYKSDFLDGRARLNLAAFLYDYRDVQVTVFIVPAPGLPGASRFRNAGDASVWGAEAELFLLPTPNFELTLGIGWADSQLDTTATISSAGQPELALDDHELPMTNLSVNGVARYSIPFKDKDAGSLTLQLDWSWMDDHFFTIDNVPTEAGDAYALANARAVWTSSNGRTKVQLFVDNIFDKEYYVFASDLGRNWGNVVWGRPRWAGVEVSFHY